MTPQIAIVLIVLAATLILLARRRLRAELVAWGAVLILVVLGALTPRQAVAGFSSPAVIVAGAMLVVSAGVARTGLATALGRQIVRVTGQAEVPRVLALMLASALMSSVMSNTGVVAMMLPVAAGIARQTGVAPSRLLLPIVVAAQVGGLVTVVGTPANLIASDALLDAGLAPLDLFDLTPFGLGALLIAIGWVGLIGYQRLPLRDPSREAAAGRRDLAEAFGLAERVFWVRLPTGSWLHGRTISECQLRPALGLHILAVQREGTLRPAPAPGMVLVGGDRLMVQGLPDLLYELRQGGELAVEEAPDRLNDLWGANMGVAEVLVSPASPWVGKRFARIQRERPMGLLALAVHRHGELRRVRLGSMPVQVGDLVLVVGPRKRLGELARTVELGPVRPIGADEVRQRYRLQDRILEITISERSQLAGRPVSDPLIGQVLGARVLGLRRGDAWHLLPAAEERLQSGDVLVVKARPQDVEVVRGLRELELIPGDEPDLSVLQTEDVGLLDVVLAPESPLVGHTPREIGFRRRFGVSLLAVWGEGEPRRVNLQDVPLKFGESLLVFGRRDRLRVVAEDASFIALGQVGQAPPRRARGPLAIGVVALVVALVALQVLPLPIAALVGALLMIATGCLSADEAYRAMEWPALVLIAAMLGLGQALEVSGTATWAAAAVVDPLEPLGPRGILLGICVMTAVGTQVVPNTAAVAIMAPVALRAAEDFGLDPHAMLLAVALSASSLATPASHPANALVVGAGGYRNRDFLKLGLPIAVLIVMGVVLALPEVVVLSPRPAE